MKKSGEELNTMHIAKIDTKLNSLKMEKQKDQINNLVKKFNSIINHELEQQFNSLIKKIIKDNRENLLMIKETYEAEEKMVSRYYHQSNIELAKANRKLYKKIINSNVRSCESMVNVLIKQELTNFNFADYSEFLIK